MAKKLTLHFDKSFAAMRPDLALDWDTENNDFTPDSVDTNSQKHVRWRCHLNPEHMWVSTVKAQVAYGKCPGCVAGADRTRPKRAVKPDDSIVATNPDIAAEWYQPYNGDIMPEEVSRGSHLRFWWRCSIHGIIWEAPIYDRTNGKGCAQCRSDKISAMRSRVEPGKSLADLYPEVAAEWDYELNEKTPDQVAAHARETAHWICVRGHRWISEIYNRTCNGAGCRECYLENAKKPKKGHSIAEMRPDLVPEWSEENGDLTPWDVSYGTNTIKVAWYCKKHNYTWWTTPQQRCGKPNTGCKFCSTENAKTLRLRPKDGVYLKDGAPHIAAEWCVEKNRNELGLELDDMALHSSVKAYWECPNCHRTYLMSVNKRTSRGYGCTQCDYSAKASFPEKAVLYYVRLVYPDAVGNASPEVEGLGRREFDIWIPSLKTAIEYDGAGWHDDSERDRHKDVTCFCSNVRLIRIRETKCPDYLVPMGVEIIERDPDVGFKSLDNAIVELLDRLGYEGDMIVDCLRDEAKIRKEMRLGFISGSLAERYPHIADCWCHEKNDGLTPSMFRPNSEKKVWWDCKYGHEPYLQSIRSRVHAKYNGCPRCNSGRIVHTHRAPDEGESLADLNPEIAAQWCYEKNDGFTPRDFKPGSEFKAYWNCPNHDEPFLTTIIDRVKGSGCGYCANKKVLKGFNDLASQHPELLEEWDYELNDISPDEVTVGSHIEVHWACNHPGCGHKWVAAVNRRVLGHGCIKCRPRKVRMTRLRPETGQSLQDLYPHLAAEWMPEDNDYITPADVKTDTKTKFVWTCSICGDKFEESVKMRVQNGHLGCCNCRPKTKPNRFRGNRKPKPGESLADRQPVLAEFLLPEKNNGVTAYDVRPSINSKFVWTCPECGDEWTTSCHLMRLRKRKCKNCGYSG